MRKLVAKGAESDVYEGSLAGMRAIFKVRNPKEYRAEELDEKLREGRTRREAKLLHTCKEAGALCPIVLSVGKYEIAMGRVRGKLMMKLDGGSKEGICREVGKALARIHSGGICHGDFTPANILVERGKVWIIDFGLGNFTGDDEDRAMDVLLMKKSLGKKAYARFVRAYSKNQGKAKATLKRLKEIEMRGRYVVRGALP